MTSVHLTQGWSFVFLVFPVNFLRYSYFQGHGQPALFICLTVITLWLSRFGPAVKHIKIIINNEQYYISQMTVLPSMVVSAKFWRLEWMDQCLSRLGLARTIVDKDVSHVFTTYSGIAIERQKSLADHASCSLHHGRDGDLFSWVCPSVLCVTCNRMNTNLWPDGLWPWQVQSVVLA